MMWCNRPPVREVCPNYDLVVFQPRTVNLPHIGSVAYCYTFKLGLPHQRFLHRFPNRYFPSSVLSPPHPYPFIVEALPLFTRFPPPLPVWSAPTWALPIPTNRQPPLLVPTPHSACLHLSPFPVMVRSPLFRPWPAPKYMSSPGGFNGCGSPHACVYLPLPPWVLLLILASSGPWSRCWVDLKARARVQGASTPWHSCALVLAPPAIWKCWHRSG